MSAVGARVLAQRPRGRRLHLAGYPGGIARHIHVSWADPNKVREVVVVGSDSRIVFNDLDPLERVRVFNEGRASGPVEEPLTFGEYTLHVRDGDIVSPADRASRAAEAPERHFLHCIRRGESRSPTRSRGTTVVRVMEAIDASARRAAARRSASTASSPRAGRARGNELESRSLTSPPRQRRSRTSSTRPSIGRARPQRLDPGRGGRAPSSRSSPSTARSPHAIGIDSGLSALELALRASGSVPGDEVITAGEHVRRHRAAIAHAGATPVLVDVDRRHLHIDPPLVEAARSPAHDGDRRRCTSTGSRPTWTRSARSPSGTAWS